MCNKITVHDALGCETFSFARNIIGDEKFLKFMAYGWDDPYKVDYLPSIEMYCARDTDAPRFPEEGSSFDYGIGDTIQEALAEYLEVKYMSARLSIIEGRARLYLDLAKKRSEWHDSDEGSDDFREFLKEEI